MIRLTGRGAALTTLMIALVASLLVAGLGSARKPLVMSSDRFVHGYDQATRKYDNPGTPAQDGRGKHGPSGDVADAEAAISGPSLASSGEPLAPEALRGVDDVLTGLPQGRQSWVRLVPDEAALRSTYDDLARGGTSIEWPGYKGTVVSRPDGVQIGIRSTSRTGGSTIDIRLPNGTTQRIHIG